MARLSLCMIVKNEEAMLEKSLLSIREICDEIIIVDTGSTDATVAIAKRFADKVLHFQWIDDFSAARNYALAQCSNPYILTWDADWILRKGDADKIKQLKSKIDRYDSIYFTWNVEVDEDNQPIRQSRYHFIFNKKLYHWESPIHNELIFNGKRADEKNLFVPEIEVFHYKDPKAKKHRYDQTRRIILQELKKNPNNTRLRIFLAQGYQFEKNYSLAVEEYLKVLENDQLTIAAQTNILERIGFCFMGLKLYRRGLQILEKSSLQNTPRIILSRADLYLGINPIRAYKLYYQYTQKPNPHFEDEFDYYPERYEVYPFLQLGRLNLMIGRKRKAAEFLKIALTNSRSKHTENTIKALLNTHHTP